MSNENVIPLHPKPLDLLTERGLGPFASTAASTAVATTMSSTDTAVVFTAPQVTHLSTAFETRKLRMVAHAIEMRGWHEPWPPIYTRERRNELIVEALKGLVEPGDEPSVSTIDRYFQLIRKFGR